MVFPSHKFEVLICDWNKYDDRIIVIALVDKSIKVWDVRSFRILIAVMNGHRYAVRKVRFLPHVRNLMIENALVSRYYHHTEFTVDVDMSVKGLMASIGWDELVYLCLAAWR
ncbi:hypothetical protein AHAS_Ahas18G0268200 [Arachis hypogaea]